MVSVSLTIGALELGVFVSTFLFGVATVQVHIYFKQFHKDGWLIKSLVGVVRFCDLINTCLTLFSPQRNLYRFLELAHNVCVCHGLFTMTLSQYTDPRTGNERRIEPNFAVAVLLSGCIAAITQAYFAYRLRVLSNSLWIPMLFWVFAFVRFMAWVWAGVIGIIACVGFSTGTHDEPQWEWPLVPLLAFGACVDFIVAALICYHFYRTQHIVVQSTARLLDKLIVWTIQNGLITSVAGIATCLTLRLAKDTSPLKILP
ncbi:hypothetical protein AX16_002805 [Volvariella volvacea WC 439]|nr:hypothetical protein AX16_002805 [Volvariella volvacea WC 439]